MRVRDADIHDAPELARLIGELGYPTDETTLRTRIARATESLHGRAIVAEHDTMRRSTLAGLLTLYRIPVLHRAGDICRITALVVSESERGTGTGRLLVGEAERYAREHHCWRMEVTSAADLTGAHAFYARLGYIERIRRFTKEL